MPGLSNDAAARILRRAAELDEPHHVDASGPTPDALRLAAAEVGISAESLERAMAEERLRDLLGLGQGSRLSRLAGTDRVWSMTVAPRDALARIDTWMRRSAHLRRVSTTGDAVIYQRRGDAVAQVARGVRQLSGTERITRPHRVTVAGTPLGDEMLVAVVAELRAEQVAAVGTAGVLGAGGVITGVVLAAVSSGLFALIAPGALAAGGAVLAGRRATMAAAQRELDGALAAAIGATPRPALPANLLDAAIEEVSRAASRRGEARRHDRRRTGTSSV